MPICFYAAAIAVEATPAPGCAPGNIASSAVYTGGTWSAIRRPSTAEADLGPNQLWRYHETGSDRLSPTLRGCRGAAAGARRSMTEANSRSCNGGKTSSCVSLGAVHYGSTSGRRLRWLGRCRHGEVAVAASRRLTNSAGLKRPARAGRQPAGALALFKLNRAGQAVKRLKRRHELRRDRRSGCIQITTSLLGRSSATRLARAGAILIVRNFARPGHTSQTDGAQPDARIHQQTQTRFKTPSTPTMIFARQRCRRIIDTASSVAAPFRPLTRELAAIIAKWPW